jgi:hypothetical protein
MSCTKITEFKNLGKFIDIRMQVRKPRQKSARLRGIEGRDNIYRNTILSVLFEVTIRAVFWTDWEKPRQILTRLRFKAFTFWMEVVYYTMTKICSVLWDKKCYTSEVICQGACIIFKKLADFHTLWIQQSTAHLYYHYRLYVPGCNSHSTWSLCRRLKIYLEVKHLKNNYTDNFYSI